MACYGGLKAILTVLTKSTDHPSIGIRIPCVCKNRCIRIHVCICICVRMYIHIYASMFVMYLCMHVLYVTYVCNIYIRM